MSIELNRNRLPMRWAVGIVATLVTLSLPGFAGTGSKATPIKFHLVEATIEDIQQAILSRQLTTVQLVNLYLERIKAYNGTCVSQPEGILGPVTPIAHAGQIN